jgi:hypothetical protein
MPTRTPSKKRLADQASELVEQVSPHVEAARDRLVNDYLPAAQTMLAEARDTAREVAQDAREAAKDAAATAEKSTRKSRKQAAKKARAKAREVAAAAAATPAAVALAEKVKPDSGKPKRKKRLVLLLGLVGVGALVFRKLRGGSTAPTYTPPRPAPAPRPSPVPDAAESTSPVTTVGGTTDAGGAFVDEVVADADEAPHPVTTPDEPLEVEDLTAESKPSK